MGLPMPSAYGTKNLISNLPQFIANFAIAQWQVVTIRTNLCKRAIISLFQTKSTPQMRSLAKRTMFGRTLNGTNLHQQKHRTGSRMIQVFYVLHYPWLFWKFHAFSSWDRWFSVQLKCVDHKVRFAEKIELEFLIDSLRGIESWAQLLESSWVHLFFPNHYLPYEFFEHKIFVQYKIFGFFKQ